MARRERAHRRTLEKVGREGVIDDPEGFVRAIDHFTRRAGRDPAFASAWARQFFALELKDAEAALARDPRDAAVRFRRADLRSRLGDFAGALKDCAVLARRLPGDRNVLILRAWTRLRLAETKPRLVLPALRDLRRAARLTPKGTRARKDLEQWIQRLHR